MMRKNKALDQPCPDRSYAKQEKFKNEKYFSFNIQLTNILSPQEKQKKGGERKKKQAKNSSLLSSLQKSAPQRGEKKSNEKKKKKRKQKKTDSKAVRSVVTNFCFSPSGTSDGELVIAARRSRTRNSDVISVAVAKDIRCRW